MVEESNAVRPDEEELHRHISERVDDPLIAENESDNRDNDVYRVGIHDRRALYRRAVTNLGENKVHTEEQEMENKSHGEGESESNHDLAGHLDVEGVEYRRRHKQIEGKAR